MFFEINTYLIICKYGTNAIICVSAPKVEWLKGGKVIKQSKFFKMSAEGGSYTLNITEAFPEDEGVYSFIASNPAGQVNSSLRKCLAPCNDSMIHKSLPIQILHCCFFLSYPDQARSITAGDGSTTS